MQGYLSEHFCGSATKVLSAVETDPSKSNQHEFNGVKELTKIFGIPKGKERFNTKFLYINDDSSGNIVDEGILTWYDARESHPKRTEYRLYYNKNDALKAATEHDLLVIAKLQDESILCIVARAGSTAYQQVKWIFNRSEDNTDKFSVRDNFNTDSDKLNHASKLILESLDIPAIDPIDQYLEDMLEKFGNCFPKTREFSGYARSTLPLIDPREDQDHALSSWMMREEGLFRTLEKHIISERLAEGFHDDVDAFIKYSLSVQNRRKSRVGLALENHLEALFQKCNVCYTRTPTTENKSKPDFIFPSVQEYFAPGVDPNLLTMLGVKSTCKDRWRQVLSEAEKIEDKHLLTFEASISTNQTDEMKAHKLQLVIPKDIHETYTTEQQSWLLSVSDFIGLALDRQKSITTTRI